MTKAKRFPPLSVVAFDASVVDEFDPPSVELDPSDVTVVVVVVVVVVVTVVVFDHSKICSALSFILGAEIRAMSSTIKDPMPDLMVSFRV